MGTEIGYDRNQENWYETNEEAEALEEHERLRCLEVY